MGRPIRRTAFVAHASLMQEVYMVVNDDKKNHISLLLRKKET